MNRCIQAYLYPFVLESKLNHPTLSKNAIHYIQPFTQIVDNCSDEIAACESEDIAEFFNKITPAEEKSFIRGILESRKLMFKDKCVSSILKKPLLMAFHKYVEDVWHESIHLRAGFELSWQLFAHLVFNVLYPDSLIYANCAAKINQHFNLAKYLMKVNEIAKKSKCKKMQVGAMLVVNGEIKTIGYNGHPADTRLDDVCLRMGIEHGRDISHGYCVHAESQILLRSNPTQLKKGTLFVTHPPCEHCARHIIQAKIPFVVFLCSGYSMSGMEMAWDLAGYTRFYGV